jgi:hypothetical protein
MLNRFLAIVWVCLLSSQIANAVEPSATRTSLRFLGKTEIAGTATDLSRQEGELTDGSPANRLGGQGSGIAWTGHGNQYVMISDRGPGDGATAYHCRFHLFDIVCDERAASAVSATLRESHLLSSRIGKPLIGAASAFGTDTASGGSRFDPEAIRASGRGTFYIADEYGPTLSEFDARGRLIAEVALPSRLAISKPAANPMEELPPQNVSGRFPNRGMESLAISPDGETLFGLMQGPLLQDEALDASGKKIGTHVRLIELQRRTGAAREFVYTLDHPDHGCSEIEWLAPGRFLVIERDGKPGIEGSVKRLFEIDLNHATDISRIDSLPATALPAGVRAVSKTLFLDLLDPQWGLIGESFPAKIEGVTFGPRLKDGSRLMVISSDNDFKPEETSCLFVFAVRTD